ncbi:RimK/LysX family protein [Candidatus Coxiella mudrowiae]|uniref:RimK/LysX family protein n=1 Tax=Candidatus Coxiella mudrowiae TaxID=2054173 RepID=UPI001FD5E38D|nr:RimK/LysX family protein [Candidatus Coxiella mudrowiae]
MDFTLPTFSIDQIKAKIDTGARTSALHAFSLDILTGNPNRLRFQLHPIQKK